MKIKPHPLFFVSVLAYLAVGGIKEYMVAFFAITLHELAHAAVASLAGVGELVVTLLPYGARMSTAQPIPHPVAVLLSGPVANLVVASSVLSACWLVPELYGFLKGFLRANVALALLNLLPAYPLDGGRLFRVLFEGRWARVLTSACTLLVGAGAGVLFCLTGNLSLLLFCVFLLCTFFLFCLPHPRRCRAEDPLFTLAMPNEEGRITGAVVKQGKKTLRRLSPHEVTRLLLTFPASITIKEALSKQGRVGYK